MFKFQVSNNNSGNGLEGIDMANALKKIPTKQLAILTFQKLYEHQQVCAATSAANLKVLKFMGVVVFGLALEKANEMFHFVQHIPTLPGG